MLKALSGICFPERKQEINSSQRSSWRRRRISGSPTAIQRGTTKKIALDRKGSTDIATHVGSLNTLLDSAHSV